MYRKTTWLSALCMMGVVWMLAGCQGTSRQSAPPSQVQAASETAATKAVPAQTEQSLNGTGVTVKPANKTGKIPAAQVGILTADTSVYQFGRVEPRQQVRGKFKLTNVGKGPLEIDRRIRTSCGCTVPDLQKYTLQPGESTYLNVKFTAGNHPGKTNKMIWVTVKPPAKPQELQLTITADIRKIIDVSPERLTFEIRKNADTRRNIVFTSSDGTPFSITGFSVTGNVATAKFDPKVKAAKITLPIEVDIKKLVKVPRGAITVNFSHPKLKYATIYFNSIPPFAAHPPTKAFLHMTPGQSMQASVKIVSNFGEKFQLGKISSKNHFIKVLGTSKTEDGYKIDYEFSMPKDSRKSFVSDYLTIEIKDELASKVTLQCYGRNYAGRRRPVQR